MEHRLSEKRYHGPAQFTMNAVTNVDAAYQLSGVEILQRDRPVLEQPEERVTELGPHWIIRFLVCEYHSDGSEYYLQVETQRPVSKIFQIRFHTEAHILHGRGLPSVSANLGEARYTRIHFVSNHVPLDELAILFVVGDRVRSRPHNAHVSLQNIYKLWKFIERVLAQNRT